MALVRKSNELPIAAPAAPRELYRDSYVSMLLDEGQKLIRFTRSAQPFPDLEAPRQTYETVIPLAERFTRLGFNLLTDLRAAPGRNDPAFEAVMGPLRSRLQAPFARRATLVATAVGAMQVRRLTKEDGMERMVSSDEAELLRYLSGHPDNTP